MYRLNLEKRIFLFLLIHSVKVILMLSQMLEIVLHILPLLKSKYFNPEYGGSMILQKAWYLSYKTAQCLYGAIYF
jgi:hypothetical protein